MNVDKVQSTLVTAMQLRCLEGVARLLDTQQIAAELGISPSTVNNHLNAAVRRLRANGRRDAVRKLIAAGQLQPSHILPIGAEDGNAPACSSSPTDHPKAPTEDQPVAVLVETGSQRDEPVPLMKLFLQIAAIAAAIVILVLALAPLVESAARLANSIQPHRR